MITSGLWSHIQAQAVQYVRMMGQDVLWLPRVTPDTPGATPTPAWDDLRGEVTAFSDGSYGVGWQAPDPAAKGAMRLGYFSPRRIRVIIEHVRDDTRWREAGVTDYEAPIVHFLPRYVTQWGDQPLAPAKGDVLVEIVDQLATGARWVVGDRTTPQTLAGQVIIQSAALEARAASDVVYTIPLPLPTTV